MDLPVGIATLQHTDRWVGIPLCAFLTLVRKITERRPSGARPPRKILFTKFAEQGSTVLAYPAISRAVEMVGRENVFFVLFDDNRFILDVMKIIPHENVIVIGTTSPFALALGALRAVLRARKLGIDAAVDMEFFTRFSAMLTFLTGAKSRVGFHAFFGDGPYRGDLMTHRLLYNPHLHTSQMFEAMVEALTRDPAILPTFDFTPPVAQKFAKFQPRPNELTEVDALLRRENAELGSAPLILLNPNASDLLPLRRWPPARYVELAKKLLARYPDLFLGFTGAPAEA
ncbi:MAG: glycosyltransferase family 9 protein, partial [Chthoniobacterales bacterium]